MQSCVRYLVCDMCRKYGVYLKVVDKGIGRMEYALLLSKYGVRKMEQRCSDSV